MTNYRGISLMSTMAKLFNRVLLNRIRPAVDRVLRPNQAGFRPGRSTISQIHALRRLLEAADEYRLNLIVSFADFKKAFDSINRQVMFAILRYYGIPAKVVSAIASLYAQSKGSVLVNGKLSKTFDITTGVLQGDVLAPFLFVIVIDFVMSRSDQNFGFTFQQQTGSRSRGTPAQVINDLDFADDVALLENSIHQANEQLCTLSLEAGYVGLDINKAKTEYMTINQRADEAETKLMLYGVELVKVENFKYLGANMKSSGYDLSCRKGIAWSAFWSLKSFWSSKQLLMRLKINIYKTAVLSILLYGCETWTMIKHIEQEIDAFGTNCMQILLGIKCIDKVPNASIYEQTEMRPITCILRERQLRYLGHVLQLDENETARKFALYAPTFGQRKRGRPKLSYARYIAIIVSDDPESCTIEAITSLAKNRVQ